jgi:hypothetical protein
MPITLAGISFCSVQRILRRRLIARKRNLTCPVKISVRFAGVAKPGAKQQEGHIPERLFHAAVRSYDYILIKKFR